MSSFARIHPEGTCSWCDAAPRINRYWQNFPGTRTEFVRWLARDIASASEPGEVDVSELEREIAGLATWSGELNPWAAA